MTKNLESLSAFESKSINQLEMGKVLGGFQQLTGSGTHTLYNGGCAIGSFSYTSDTRDGYGHENYSGITAN